MREYVLGFCFYMSLNQDLVILIHKKRGPQPVIGKYNGIGGRVEMEHVDFAMVREFREETGIRTSLLQWRRFGELHMKAYDAIVHLYTMRGKWLVKPVLQQEADEEVFWHPVSSTLSSPHIVPNLQYLIPLAMSDGKEFTVITEPK